MKRSVSLVMLLFTSALFLTSCAGGNRDESISGDKEGYREAKGNRFYGGILKVNESEYIRNLFPHNITDVYSYRVASQVYEGLFKFNSETLEVEKNLIDSYTVDESGTKYKFNLKKGVFFHNDPCFTNGQGREFVAEDVAYCFTRLATPHRNNQNAAIFRGLIAGAEEWYKAAQAGNRPSGFLKGIQVLDRYTVEITLTEPNAIFPVHLARPPCFIYPKEAEKKYGQELRIKAVGTGPFTMGEVSEDISILLRRNERYHGEDEFGNQLPFLDAISIQFLKDKKSELLEFKKGNLDLIYRLPTDYIIQILEESASKQGEYSQYNLQRVPEMVTQFIAFQNRNSAFDDVQVRKAFNYAIDRQKILDFVLNGEGFAPGHHGITPPVFSQYDIHNIPGYSFNPDSARFLLKAAGYPDGKGFPSVELILNAEGERNTNVAVEIQKELKDNLNVDVKLTVLPFAQMLDMGYKGSFDMMRAAWYADYPHPESFLWLFYGKNVPTDQSKVSYPNMMRYNNPRFNRLYEQALAKKDIAEAEELLARAEKVMIKDAPVIILWYDEGYRLLHSYVRNFPNNGMQYRDYAEVYFQRAKKLETM
ncbi:ABC transporter substrate-binding protein [Roseivirga sp. BDSF3-8]|uniref:ABC transporter substrate-binding protein n=1 Tax=Roseivirga sp. BDSF3-8 TaxID=3241598 RepID=UPI003531CE72